MGKVLCILTYEAILILDMEAILNSEKWNEEYTLRPPPLKKWIKLDGENLPLGMGCIKLDNTLYMFGGEFCKDLYTSGFPMFGNGMCGKIVYELDLCNLDSNPTCAGTLKGPKYVSIVFEFSSKIYILSSYCLELADTFEVWDPISRESSSLPLPPLIFESSIHPHYHHFGEQRISNHFLTGRGIVVEIRKKLLFFNIDNRTWESWPELSEYPVSDQLSESPVSDQVRLKGEPSKSPVSDRVRLKGGEPSKSSVSDRVRLKGVPAPGYDDVILSFNPEGLMVNLLPRSPHEPCLSQTFDVPFNYHENLPYGIRLEFGIIADSNEHGYTCALLPCAPRNRGAKIALMVYVFQVDKRASSPKKAKLSDQNFPISEKNLFDVRSLCKQVYEFDFQMPRREGPLYYLLDAFICTLPKASRSSKAEEHLKREGMSL